jgi:hypothetical protein
MNTDDDDRDDRLLEVYRRASDAQAGRPDESTRKAILEGARAVARGRQPAANDSRYFWSAVAGVAVLGLAISLWRQADPRLVATVPVRGEAASAPPAVLEEAQRPAAGRISSLEQPVVEQGNKAESAKSESRVVATQVPAADAVIDEGARKLRDRFPEAWTSPSPPAMVWIAEDARGNLVRLGTLATGEPLPTLQSATAGWTMQTAVNRAGVPVRIATTREALSPPATTVAPAEVDR